MVCVSSRACWGFFFSSIGRDIRRPIRFILLIYLGALCLAAGVIALGVGLLTVRSAARTKPDLRSFDSGTEAPARAPLATMCRSSDSFPARD